MESFEYLSGNYYRDAKSIYYDERGVIEGADPNTFEVLYDKKFDFPSNFSKDKNNLYYYNMLIESHPLDQDTVEPSSGVTLIDANGDQCEIERNDNDMLICEAI